MASAPALLVYSYHISSHPHGIRSRPTLKHIYPSACPKRELNQTATTHKGLHSRASVNCGEINDEGGVIYASGKIKFAYSLSTWLHHKADDAVGDQHGHHFYGRKVRGSWVSLHALLPTLPLLAGWDTQLLLPPTKSLPLPHLHHSDCKGQ